MAPTADGFLDLPWLLEQHPELRAEFRRQLASEELTLLQGQLAELPAGLASLIR